MKNFTCPVAFDENCACLLKDEKNMTKGTRVVRGTDWEWGDQDKNGEGEVIEETVSYSEGVTI